MFKHLFTLLITTVFFLTNVFDANAQQMQGPAGQPASSVKVSDAELEKFVAALNNVNEIQQTYQQEMAQTVVESGLTIERFNKIASAQQDPAVEVEASPQEMEQFQNVAQEISASREEIQSDMKEAVADAGMEIDRYQLIMQKANEDQQFQQRLQAAMQ